jgi:large subunit ribosomal protein L28
MRPGRPTALGRIRFNGRLVRQTQERDSVMPGVCNYCAKSPTTGRKYVTRGVPKWKGGIGVKITGKTKRWFKPNLQHFKVVEANGHVHRVWVCSKCVKSGRITKAPKQKLLAKARAEAKA